MDRPENVRILHDLQRNTRTIRWMTTIALVWVGLLTVSAAWFTIRAWQDTNDVQEAVCTFREDLQSRLDQTRSYLQKHPEGFPGVSNATLTQSIRNQQATIDSLRFLSCDPDVKGSKPNAASRSQIRARVVAELIPPMPPTTAKGERGGTTQAQRASPRTGRRVRSRPTGAPSREVRTVATILIAAAALITDAYHS